MQSDLSPRDFYRHIQSLHSNTSYQHSISEGQKPHTFMISCCDSRVDPTLLFGADIASIFSLRTIANIVPHYHDTYPGCPTAAALHYAIGHLHIPQIIILGHSACGGIHALCQHTTNDKTHAITTWLQCAQDSLDYVMPELPPAISLQTDQQSMRTLASSYHNIQTYPIVQAALQAKSVSIQAWFYHMEASQLYSYDVATNRFVLE